MACALDPNRYIPYLTNNSYHTIIVIRTSHSFIIDEVEIKGRAVHFNLQGDVVVPKLQMQTGRLHPGEKLPLECFVGDSYLTVLIENFEDDTTRLPIISDMFIPHSISCVFENNGTVQLL